MTGARWGILAVPALLYSLSDFHRVAPVVAAANLMVAVAVAAAALGPLSATYHNLPAFRSFGLAQWLTGAVLDRLWDGTLERVARVCSAGAYRAAFALCLAGALGTFLSRSPRHRDARPEDLEPRLT